MALEVLRCLLVLRSVRRFLLVFYLREDNVYALSLITLTIAIATFCLFR